MYVSSGRVVKPLLLNIEVWSKRMPICEYRPTDKIEIPSGKGVQQPAIGSDIRVQK